MSVRALALDSILKRVFARGNGNADVREEVARRRAGTHPVAAPVPQGVSRKFDVATSSEEDSPVVRLTHPGGQRRRAVVYLPGGGYAQPISAQHWAAIARFARAADIDAVVPCYEVAPVGDAERAHRLVAQTLARTITRYGHGEVLLAGDSAGAGLALSALQRHPDGVHAAVLLNPWLDVEIRHPAASVIEDWDVILHIDELRAWGKVWAGDLSTGDPAVSPLRGSFDGLPPVHIVTGGRDLLMPDAMDAHRLLAAAGNAGSLTYSPDGNHAVGLLGNTTPEGARAFAAIVRALRGSP